MIEANPKKIKALLEMSSPKKPKEVIGLVGKVAALSSFVSRVIDHCVPFFDVLKGSLNEQISANKHFRL